MQFEFAYSDPWNFFIQLISELDSYNKNIGHGSPLRMSWLLSNMQLNVEDAVYNYKINSSRIFVFWNMNGTIRTNRLVRYLRMFGSSFHMQVRF